ncbi:tannase/feruloyl esterase family alpha/beta hydrolase [Spongiactinospora sp. TRM90649]|uniref:tannase/feruloyl esterase family alpha/beta hydrolase n=1 Tax=Spongiactinospora sp. TRM90649 TaxID=3031114 RepID=UPI0023F6AA7E|nr:tannase/feruloyl esterase family alpha/beta hydrolase [Spongiactinospora sp. TRM90649]MDF5759139.1 tannase/feruloyl esterase family alpha/beta hydrolase [Spongiactinospora sp. TRM90649]
MGSPTVPGAERQVASFLADLTTAGTVASGRTVPDDWAGLHAGTARNPTGVPGWQIDGCFPARSRLNTHHGWDHDAQFVMRLPEAWNGGLVVTGAPGLRRQYAVDFLIADWVLAGGYAYAATDKGNSGPGFHTAGSRPGDALADWHRRTTELTQAARRALRRHYGAEPRRTYVTGVSNGGYLTRWQLENQPDLYDGGVDWAGPLWRADGPNVLTYIPTALRNYPGYRDGRSARAHPAMIEAGFPAGSEFVWADLHAYHWPLTQRVYRACLDPYYEGADETYDYAARPGRVHEAVARISLTGRVGRPMLSLHGTLDALLPITLNADPYAAMAEREGRGHLHRLYRIEGGNHVDGFCDRHPGRLTPMLPHYRAAFESLTRWVEDGLAPPPSGTITSNGDTAD